SGGNRLRRARGWVREGSAGGYRASARTHRSGLANDDSMLTKRSIAHKSSTSLLLGRERSSEPRLKIHHLGRRTLDIRSVSLVHAITDRFLGLVRLAVLA